MRHALLLQAVLLVPAAIARADTPVLVELFSSEGCSSCPPADDVLRTLQVPGVDVIPLEWHVDYWNDLGWADPFSSPEATERQQRYVQLLGIQGPYTPQMIVDGRREFVGSNRAAAVAAVVGAARPPSLALSLAFTGDRRVRASGLRGTGKATLLVAITEAGLETSVTRGENAGRRLVHAPVVRWSTSRSVPAGATAIDVDLPLNAGWRRDRLTAVVWVQAPDGTVRGAARTAWPVHGR